MLSLLPKKKDNSWFKFFIIMFLIISITITMIASILLDFNWKDIKLFEEVFSVLVLAFIPSLIASLSGYFGRKVIVTSTLIGVIIGLGFMINFFRNDYELSSLVGIVAFFDVVIGRIVVGVIGEIIRYFISKKKNRLF